MSIQLVWRDRADQDMIAHVSYLAERSHTAAERFVSAVKNTCELLRSSPELGTIVASESQIRAWPIGGFQNYVLLFRSSAASVEVVRLLHGSRNWQEIVTSPEFRRLT